MGIQGGYTMLKNEQCCCCKTTKRDEETLKKLTNRLNRIEGQIRGIKKMLESDAYCNDILIQSSAVNSALSAFNRELLKEHISTCVVRDIKNGNEDIVEELTDTLSKLIK